MLVKSYSHTSLLKFPQLKNIFDASISAVTWSLIGRKWFESQLLSASLFLLSPILPISSTDGLAFGPSIDSSGFLPGKSGFAVYAGQATAYVIILLCPLPSSPSLVPSAKLMQRVWSFLFTLPVVWSTRIGSSTGHLFPQLPLS